MPPWLDTLFVLWERIEGIVSLLIGFYLGHFYWRKQTRKEAVNAIRDELALNHRMPSQRRHVLVQMAEHLEKEGILPAVASDSARKST